MKRYDFLYYWAIVLSRCATIGNDITYAPSMDIHTLDLVEKKSCYPNARLWLAIATS